MLYGDLRGFANALITRDKYKANGELRALADAIISGDKYKAPGGQLRDLADALISRDKYKAPSGPLRDFANALISGDKYKAPSGPLRDTAAAILSSDKHKAPGDGCYIATASLGHIAYQELDTLRRFRDEIVGATVWGRQLVGYYRRTAPLVAEHISRRAYLKNSFLYPFILPSLGLLRRWSTKAWANIAVYGLFLLGLGWATCLSIWIKLFGHNSNH